MTPLIVQEWGNEAWSTIWILFGLASFAAFLPTIWAIRNLHENAADQSISSPDKLPLARMWAALTSYFLFGLGYLIYLTFLVAWMRSEGESPVLIAVTWSIMGIATMFSPFVWRGILARSNGGEAMAYSGLVTGLGVLSAVVVSAPWGVLVSAALVGIAFYIVPTSATNFGRKNFPQEQWGRSFAAFTIVFSIGQILGPFAAGVLTDLTNDISVGLTMAGAILILCAAAAALQRPL